MDPYHERAPPKKETKKPIDPSELPVKPLGPVRVLPYPTKDGKPVRGKGHRRILWYRCDNCGELYMKPGIRRSHGMHGFCPGGKCEREWEGKYRAENPLTEEQRRKIGSGARGKPRSEEQRRKMADSKRGKPRSEETKQKVSDARKELYKDPEFREKMNRAINRPEVKEKQAKAKQGPNNPNWKGGASQRKRPLTPADEYRESWDWRKKSEEIRDRDDNTCAGCGQKSEDGSGLDVHHTYPLNKWIEEGNDPNDYPDDWLMTLDKSCHTKADAEPGDFKLPRKESSDNENPLS